MSLAKIDIISLVKKINDKKEVLIYILTALILIAATYKYVAYGETYIFETPWTGDRVELNNSVISQDIIIDEKAKWEPYSFSVYFDADIDLKSISGYIEISLTQGDINIQTYQVDVKDIEGGWYELNQFDYSVLKKGAVTVSLRGINLDHAVYLGLCENIYNIPDALYNNDKVVGGGGTLTQRYHYNFVNYEYKIRCLLYFIVVLVNIFAVYFVIKKEDTREGTNLVRVCLIITHMCLAYVYNSSYYLSPTWAEAVINFMDNAIHKGVMDNLLITDAGYLPLFQRLITLFVYKVLKLPIVPGLYFMQITAYFISGCFFSFFIKHQFSECLCLKYRYAFCIFFMVQVTEYGYTNAFINFITYGVIIIFFYFLVDSIKWNKIEFFIICIMGGLACLSKGYYVTIFPVLLLSLLLFYKNFTKRDFIFTSICSIASFLQLIYYFGRNNWKGGTFVDVKGNAGTEGYYLKLILHTLMDVPNMIIKFFLNSEIFNGITLLIVVFFWLYIISLFVKHVVMCYVSKTRVDRNTQAFFIMIIYLAAQSLFMRISVAGVDSHKINSDVFWTFHSLGEITSRYSLSFYIAVGVIFVVCIKVLQKEQVKSIQGKAILGWAICLMILKPCFQLKGIGNDDYVNLRPHMTDVSAEINLLRGIEDVPCRFVPIQPQWYDYRKNADIYCFGTDIFEWYDGSIVVDSDEANTGHLHLDDYREVNKNCEIWQVFIKKKNLINRNSYQIVLLDAQGKVIGQKWQDNSNFQLIASFTFDKGINDISEIIICDENDNKVYIEDAIYVVTEERAPFLIE